MGRKLFLAQFLFVSFFVNAQQSKIDSLKNILKNSEQDSTTLRAYRDIATQYSYSDISLAEKYSDSMIAFAISKKSSKYELTGYSQRGILEYQKGNFNKAIDIWKNSLKHKDIEKHRTQQGNFYNNIALGYRVLHENDSVAFYLTKSIGIWEKLNRIEGFSPNDDTINDEFEISGLLNVFEDFILKVYSRKGNLIFEGRNDDGFWAAIPNTGLLYREVLVPTGLYYYVLQLNDPEYPEPFLGFVYVNY